MSLTPSNMLPLGTPAPDFALPDTVSNKTMHLKDLKSDTATVIMFICNHCPYVKHIQQGITSLAKDYQKKGIALIAINSNDAIKYPDDAPEKMREEAKNAGYTFPYLYDETQEIAKKYDAACTPDFYVFDKSMRLVYRGRLDDSRPGNHLPVTGKDLRAALDAIIAGKMVDANQHASMGCNIKWK